MGLKGNTVSSVISDFTVAAARFMKAIMRKATDTKWRLLLTIAVGALLAVLAMKLMALLGAAFDISFLRNSGSETGNGAGFGAGGAGLGGAGGSGGGTGGPSDGKRPWWENWLPSSWTTITVGPVSIDTTTGHVSFGPVDVGVTPGGDPHGPIIDIGVKTPVGTQPVASVGISQQVQQNVSGPMGSQGTQSGAWLNNFMKDGN
jgi:hypothetical protein